MRAPEFWTRDGPLPRLLGPLGAAYGLAGRVRAALATPRRAPVPVVCVGNLTVGGTGKTPLALALAGHLAATGRRPHLLTRGYGGRLRGPLRVDPTRHDAAAVGDEALLLAGAAPTWLARDRAAGALAAAAAGAGVVVMDDGYQNPTLAKDLALVVVDGATGFGNGRLLPAGPLREPVAEGLRRASALVVVGPDRAGVARLAPPGLPILEAEIRPAADAPDLSGRRVLAFAGIGRPDKLFDLLRAEGAELVAARAFADHHAYRRPEVEALLAEAARLGALPVTTAKDAVRLPADLRRHVAVLPVALALGDPAALDALLAPLFGHPDGNKPGAFSVNLM
ncbi:MAG TPA: tetraacyldisaccharide 4'-kinase [Geminicoccaceae bacterium]|nr:tetraacyldisaccharide 4'-kinase [Geminicoccaceae bacterium]